MLQTVMQLSCAVAHYLVLDLLPAGDAALYQYLIAHGLKRRPLERMVSISSSLRRDTTAAAAQRIRRAKHYRISDLLRKGHTIFYVLNYDRRGTRLMNLLHRGFELQTILRLLDRKRRRADQALRHSPSGNRPPPVPSPGSVLPDRPESEGCCPASLLQIISSRTGTVRGSMYTMIRDILVCHDGCRVGVHQYNLNSFFLQSTAGLCSCIVKLCGLADDDRAGTDDQHFFNFWILSAFLLIPPSSE